MKVTKKMISNIIFYGLIIFILTPYGRPKFLQAVSYVKSAVISPSIAKESERTNSVNLNVKLTDLIGNEDINLSDLKGKVIFINYWATWCAPCRAEMPSIQKLYNDYKDKIAFVFITSDSKLKVTKFYLDNNYKLPTYNLITNPPNEINTNSLPTTFILDKKARIVARETGASNWNSSSVRKMLDRLLAE